MTEHPEDRAERTMLEDLARRAGMSGERELPLTYGPIISRGNGIGDLLLASMERRRALIDGDQWFTDAGEALDFARALHLVGAFADVDAVLYYFEKPYKWTEEHKDWVLADRPRDVSDLGYGPFEDAFDRRRMRQ